MQPQQRMYGYFASCFFSTYLHFALPRTAVGSLIPYSIRTPKTVDVHMKKVIYIYCMKGFSSYSTFTYLNKKLFFFTAEAKAQVEENHAIK